jgi:hypothetical protein
MTSSNVFQILKKLTKIQTHQAQNQEYLLEAAAQVSI